MKRRIKRRYIVAAGIILASILITPWCIRAAYEYRGYEAIGGEYAVIPLGIVLAYGYLEIVNALDYITLRTQRTDGGGIHEHSK